MKCTVTVTPISGKPSVTDVDFEGVPSVKEVLEKAGLSAGKDFNIFIVGRPAMLISGVPDGANVALTEKVAGS